MKILYFSPHPNLYLQIPSGPGVHMREMIQAFEGLGHVVKPLIMGGIEKQMQLEATAPAKKSVKEQLKGVIPAVLWATAKDFNLSKFDRYAKQELLKAIELFQPDVIYERANFGMTSGVEAAHEKNIPHILEMNAPYPEEKAEMEGKGLFHTRAIRKEKEQLSKTNLVVVVSTALKKYVEERAPAQQVVVTPNAIRSSFIPSGTEPLRIRFNIPENATVFGFVGSIFPYHGVDRLIEAFEKLANPSAHLLIVGDGYVLDNLKQQASALGIAQQVTFTGSVPHEEIAHHIACMDIAIMATSNWYGSPVKIFEYGAMQKAIIAPDVVPVQDVMINGTDGLLVQPTIESISAAMQELLENRQLRERLAKHFHQKVMTEHTWRKMAERVLSALN